MRKKRLFLNTITSFVLQIITIICGFILPRLIIGKFGSEINGLVNSITQFLLIITFLEFGVGAVVQSALYKPLAERNDDEISRIVTSAEKFFRNLSYLLLVYVTVLAFVYPFITQRSFDWLFTDLLLLAMCISSFAQYYFGIVDNLLLKADQKGYILYISQAIALIVSTFICVVLINSGASIQIVKLTASMIFLMRPIAIRIYIKKKYTDLNRKIQYSEEPIRQKRNGFAQHIAAVVLNSTDAVVLTLFASLMDVSIYSVYRLVIFSVQQLFVSMTSGIQSLFGELWARQETDKLIKVFGLTKWVIHTGSTLVFGCTAMLLLPFVRIYTAGISDTNYVQPLFAVLISIAYACYCAGIPYLIMILAAGHYKQTQTKFFISAGINIIISIAMVKLYGLIGVAIGTLAAMLYQMSWMAFIMYRGSLSGGRLLII